MNRIKIKPIVSTAVLVVYLVLFIFLFRSIEETVNATLTIGRFNAYTLIWLPILFYVGFGVISSLFLDGIMSSSNKAAYWIIVIILVYLSILPIIYFTPITIFKTIAWPYPRFFVTEKNFDINMISLFRILLGLTLGIKFLAKTKK